MRLDAVWPEVEAESSPPDRNAQYIDLVTTQKLLEQRRLEVAFDRDRIEVLDFQPVQHDRKIITSKAEFQLNSVKNAV